jgi:hypothetical protein
MDRGADLHRRERKQGEAQRENSGTGKDGASQERAADIAEPQTPSRGWNTLAVATWSVDR